MRILLLIVVGFCIAIALKPLIVGKSEYAAAVQELLTKPSYLEGRWDSKFKVPVDGTLKNLSIEAADKSEHDWASYQVLVNGKVVAPPTLSCALWKSSTCSDTTHEITIKAGDTISIASEGLPSIYWSGMFIP